MIALADLDSGVQVMFAFWALSLLFVFCIGVLLGFVAWMRSFLG